MVQKKQVKKNIYTSFVNSFISKGKTFLAKKIVNDSFQSLSKIMGVTSISLLISIYNRLDASVEIKRVKIKRRTYTIPFTVNYSRRIYLIIKKIKDAVRSDNRKINTTEKLKIELHSLFNTSQQSRAIKSLKQNQTQIRTSRSNIHFRWK